MSLAIVARELRSLERDVAHLQSIRRGGDPIPGRRPRISPGRTHKASNAESILRHALRRLGWSREWRDGELTERQLLRLLDAIRQYGRAWLRHEAEQFFREYGRRADEPRVLDRGHHGDDRQSPDQAAGPRDVSMAQGAVRSLAAAMQHHVGRFFGRAKQFVRELILAGAMAIGGPEPLGADDLAAADHEARVQAAYLDRFHREVAAHAPPEIAAATAPPDPEAMSAAQFIARAELYGNSAWSDPLNIARLRVIREGKMKWERRVHSRPPGHHECKTCIDAAAAGWQPIGSLPPIGDSECHGSCDCYFRYSEERPAA